jgi:K+-transporting ATPase ATPase C chain
MNTYLRPAIVLVALFTILTGLIMPGVMAGISGAVLPYQAGGSLIQHDGHIVGSALIGQDFAGDTYFHPRPSATTDTDPKDPTKTISSPYNASGSAGSNLGPTSQALVDRVKVDVAKLGVAPVPVDAVTTSASGLDPDISPENAGRQVARIADARHRSITEIQRVLDAHTHEPVLGFIGEPRVNVLEANLALDALPATALSAK